MSSLGRINIHFYTALHNWDCSSILPFNSKVYIRVSITALPVLLLLALADNKPGRIPRVCITEPLPSALSDTSLRRNKRASESGVCHDCTSIARAAKRSKYISVDVGQALPRVMSRL